MPQETKGSMRKSNSIPHGKAVKASKFPQMSMIPLLDDGEYSFRDLVDMWKAFARFLEKFSRATGFTIGLSQFPTKEVLIATGRKEICTKFHRASSRIG
jgi:hypothetical protein